MNNTLIDLLFNCLNKNELRFFEDSSIDRVKYFKSSKLIEIEVTLNKLIPLSIYDKVNEFFQNAYKSDVKLNVCYKNKEIEISLFLSYFYSFIRTNSYKANFGDCIPVLEDDKVVLFFESNALLDSALSVKNEFEEYLRNYAIEVELVFDVKEINYLAEDREYKTIITNEPKKVEKNLNQPRKKGEYLALRIKDLQTPIEQVKIEGKIFKIDNRKTKYGKYIQSLGIVGENGACYAKRFESSRNNAEMIESTKVNQWYTFFGNYQMDNYTRSMNFTIDKMEPLAPKESDIEDNEPMKRVEFHTHSNRSEMDGVSEVEELVELAFKLGHKGLALTDHMVIQGFPKAQNTVKRLLKANPDKEFKMVYGVEMNMVDEKQTIVHNATDDKLKDIEYVVFDVETTGLSAKYDHIIEFAATAIKNDMVVDTLNMFIKPPVSIPAKITALTNIRDSDVKDAKTFSEVKDDILNFFKGRVLVAHNAMFDYDFINEELKRLDEEPITNPIIDTLAMARNYIRGKRSYRLGVLANHFKIEYRDNAAHRADYDVNILVNVFQRLRNEAYNNNVVSLIDLQNDQDENAFTRLFKNHIVALAKNQKGLKDLFKLVSISNTDNLAVFGKANSKSSGEENVAEPRIIRSNINKYRENILIGSACLNGEIFELAMNKGDEKLEEYLKFYDYIEVQPLENYRPLVEKCLMEDTSRLQLVVERIIKTAIKLNLMVIASGDVHYAKKEDKIARDVYIQSQGIGGSRHPLYISDSIRRYNSTNPDQHYRTTDEMLKAFEWLDDEKLAFDIVIKNTNALLNEFEDVYPIHNDLFPPTIEGSTQKLKDVCYETAHRLYGETLPEIIVERLERELKSIIGNGYDVIYYISHLLVKKSNEDGYLVGSRGSVGSSFAATMSGITEVNPLPPHYLCPNCQKSIWIEDKTVISGYDLADKECECGGIMKGEGQDIPFETFLGFEGDKVPDIDLNFSGEYQEHAHLFTREVFGDQHVFRAGTISTVQAKTAYGYVLGYNEMMNIDDMSSAYKEYLSTLCEGVKRTTGQHPGGIIVIPSDKDVYDFTPVQFPANNPESVWKTTHFDFHDIHDNVLKLDILGHVDPTVMRFLQNVSGIDPTTIPMNDEKVLSLFGGISALNIDERNYNEATGACGLPEFGTKFVRKMLEQTKPSKFSELVCISGLSHGTDVWLNNAEELVKAGNTLQQVIGCRDDIMSDLIKYGLENKEAFDIMESVRKGKGLRPNWIESMHKNNVPEWYIDSCQKIKYMFPKAHAVAYVTMAVRVAWFKVYYPHFYYASYFSKRCDAYEIETMVKDSASIAKRMSELNHKILSREASAKESNIYGTLEICFEMVNRGYRMLNIDIDRSLATEFKIDENDHHNIIPPFTILDGLGDNVAISIVEAREKQPFLSIEDLKSRTLLSTTLTDKLQALNCLDHLDESNQISLF